MKQVYLCECMPSTIFKLLGLTTEYYMDHIIVLFKYIFSYHDFFQIQNKPFYPFLFGWTASSSDSENSEMCLCDLSLHSARCQACFKAGGNTHCCWPLNPASYEIMDVLLESLALAILFNQLFRKLLHWGLACLYSWQPSVLMITHFMCQSIKGKI